MKIIFLFIRLQLHGAIYRPDSFVLMLRYCANLKAISYESTSLNRIVADKSHSVIILKKVVFNTTRGLPILLLESNLRSSNCDLD